MPSFIQHEYNREARYLPIPKKWPFHKCITKSELWKSVNLATVLYIRVQRLLGHADLQMATTSPASVFRAEERIRSPLVRVATVRPISVATTALSSSLGKLRGSWKIWAWTHYLWSRAVHGRIGTWSHLTAECVMSFWMVNCFCILMRWNMLWNVGEWTIITTGPTVV